VPRQALAGQQRKPRSPSPTALGGLVSGRAGGVPAPGECRTELVGVLVEGGRQLGSVPGDVAHRAPCDVLIVQTTQAAAEERLSA